MNKELRTNSMNNGNTDAFKENYVVVQGSELSQYILIDVIIYVLPYVLIYIYISLGE